MTEREWTFGCAGSAYTFILCGIFALMHDWGGGLGMVIVGFVKAAYTVILFHKTKKPSVEPG